MPGITVAALVLGAGKLGFSTALLAFGAYRLGLGPTELQTLAFVTLAADNQAAGARVPAYSERLLIASAPVIVEDTLFKSGNTQWIKK
jgi:hypothetical protein